MTPSDLAAVAEIEKWFWIIVVGVAFVAFNLWMMPYWRKR